MSSIHNGAAVAGTILLGPKSWNGTSRRSFIKQSASLVSALALARCAPSLRGERRAALTLDTKMLAAVARVVLPASALGPAGVDRAVGGFQKWLDGFEPVAELDHLYLSSEIPYGPPDPTPRWTAQLEALELESQKRHGRGFQGISLDYRRALIRRHIGGESLDALPRPAEARHVALGLLAYFYATSEANDLCYQAAIERHTCRGLDTAPEKPPPLKKRA